MELRGEGFNGIKSTVVCPYFINTGMFEGARARILPFLDSKFVVNQIMLAILSNQTVLYTPRVLYLLMVIKSIAPTHAMYSMNRIFGLFKMMRDFKGREGAQEVKIDINMNGREEV